MLTEASLLQPAGPRGGIPTTRLAGLDVAVLDRSETARLIVRRSLERRTLGGPCDYHTTINGQVAAEWRSSPVLAASLLEADVISSDGMPLVFASRFFGTKTLPGRVNTTDLFYDVAAIAEREGTSFYLLGADEETNNKAAETVKRLYPALKLAGRRNGFFRPDEELDVVTEINAASPDILWVGMGVPRQQEFALTHKANLTSVGVLKTCGGLFKYLSGELPRAPLWMQRSGCEWLYLACLDPRKRLMRYVRTNPRAIYNVCRDSPFRFFDRPPT